VKTEALAAATRALPSPGGSVERPRELAGWGRAVRVPAREIVSEDLAAITGDVPLTRGLGRSYGDASLPASAGARVASSRLADRILCFDQATGRLRAEAGLSLAALNRTSLSRRWFTPVSPGTQHVTLGGMVAADIHGKNHHVAGSFGEHVRGLRLRLADGRIIDCSAAHEPDLFRATIGGFGLTGHILEVELDLERIPTPWIRQRIERVAALEPLFERLVEASASSPFTVAWVDALARGRSFGRGVLIAGRWAAPDEAPAGSPGPRRALGLPLDLPALALNRLSVGLFNRLYLARARSGVSVVHPEAFFYPLDVVGDWYRAYGRSGFIQYQCVLPREAGPAAPVRFMRRVAELDADPYLCVVKDFGREGCGTIAFARPGTTVSLDIAFRGAATRRIVDALDGFVLDHGGRVYLAKDALTRAETFRAMEPRLAAWNAVRARVDPRGLLESALSRRLELGVAP
jgi:FAD/FMN-containing dehydrogenase